MFETIDIPRVRQAAMCCFAGDTQKAFERLRTYNPDLAIWFSGGQEQVAVNGPFPGMKIAATVDMRLKALKAHQARGCISLVGWMTETMWKHNEDAAIRHERIRVLEVFNESGQPPSASVIGSNMHSIDRELDAAELDLVERDGKLNSVRLFAQSGRMIATFFLNADPPMFHVADRPFSTFHGMDDPQTQNRLGLGISALRPGGR